MEQERLIRMAANDPQIAAFIQKAYERQRFQQLVSELSEVCFDKCVDEPSAKFESKTQRCVSNCVERFLDTNQQISSVSTSIVTWVSFDLM